MVIVCAKVITKCVNVVQAQSRTGMVDRSDKNIPATAGSREADLDNQIKHLREELTCAQETAAAAQGHSKQYESLARSSDEAVKAMQVRDADAAQPGQDSFRHCMLCLCEQRM